VKHEETSTRPSTYVAPSFSWASKKSQIHYDDHYDVDTEICKVLDAELFPTDTNYKGVLTGGYLKLRGPARVVKTLSIDTQTRLKVSRIMYDDFECTVLWDHYENLLKKPQELPDGTILLPLSVTNIGKDLWLWPVYALLLKPTGRGKGEYERIALVRMFLKKEIIRAKPEGYENTNLLAYPRNGNYT
jgi:hypothetical protein